MNDIGSRIEENKSELSSMSVTNDQIIFLQRRSFSLFLRVEKHSKFPLNQNVPPVLASEHDSKPRFPITLKRARGLNDNRVARSTSYAIKVG